MTATTDFTPQRADGRSEWRVIYDILATKEPNEIVTYRDLMEALDTEDRSKIYGAMVKANPALRAKRQRSAEVVRNTGYRILPAKEHRRQADGYLDKARRRVATGVQVLESTRVEELTPGERRLHEAAVLVASGMQSQLDHVERRTRRLEDALGL